MHLTDILCVCIIIIKEDVGDSEEEEEDSYYSEEEEMEEEDIGAESDAGAINVGVEEVDSDSRQEEWEEVCYCLSNKILMEEVYQWSNLSISVV